MPVGRRIVRVGVGGQGGDGAGEFGYVVETFVNGCKADIGHLVGIQQCLHGHFADEAGGDFFFAQSVEAAFDFGNQVVHVFAAEGAFVQGAFEAGAQFVRVIGNPAAVAFDDVGQADVEGFGGDEAFVARGTAAAAADAAAFVGQARIGN